MERKTPYIFWYVNKGDTLLGIIQGAFQITNQKQLYEKMAEVLKLNPHIKDPNRIYAGMALALGPANGFKSQPVYESDLKEMTRIFTEDPAETRAMLDNWELLHFLSDETPRFEETFPSASSSSPLRLKSALGPNIDSKTTNPFFQFDSKYAYKLLKASNKTSQDAIKGKMGNLLKVSPHVFRKIEGELVHGIEDGVRYLKKSNGSLGLIPQGARAFGSNGRYLIVNPSQGAGLNAFSRSVQAGKDLGKTLLKPAGKIFKAIDFGLYVKNVGDAIGTQEQNRTISKETGKYAGGLAVGSTSRWIAGPLCGYLTISTGPAGIACYLTVYLVVPTVGSAIGEIVGDAVYSAGNTLYQLYGSLEDPFFWEDK